MKKLLSVALALLLVVSGCGSKDKDSGGSTNTDDSIKIGMVTDAGTIDDKSFNQGTWEGVLQARDELGITEMYLKPEGTTTQDYLTKIKDLYDTGHRMIVTPGYKFEVAIHEAQELYKDAFFVLLDGQPQDGNYVFNTADNTLSIFFAEHESGFIAGVAAAIELQEASFGFIGGMEVPAVQKFNWGFQQGVAYANENFGTNIAMNEENFVYQGTFDDVAAGQQLAAQMYERGVDVIFAAAGGVGVGVINEAIQRARAGEEIWVIGVDVDQYPDGIYEGNNSVILTSAMKNITGATFNAIKDYVEGNFKGGRVITLDASNDGIGLPSENPNLSDETIESVAEIFEMIASGSIEVLGGDEKLPSGLIK